MVCAECGGVDGMHLGGSTRCFSASMGTHRFEAEKKAAEALVALLESARECKVAHDHIPAPYPPPLARILGVEGSDG